MRKRLAAHRTLGTCVVALVLALSVTGIADAFSRADAYSVARTVGRRVARNNDADSFVVRRCWATAAHRGYCTIRYYGYNGGAYDCFDRLRMYESSEGGTPYMNSRFYSSTC